MNNNSLFDTRPYEVEFSDVTTEVLTANIISENILVKVNEEVHHQILLDEIINHRQNCNDIGKEDAFTETTNGMNQGKITTAGSHLCIQYKDRSTNWVTLKYIKQSYTVELEYYTKKMRLLMSLRLHGGFPMFRRREKSYYPK